jgi:repressor LexA
MDAELTPTQAEVLAAIRGRVDRGEPAPTNRELCAEFGWASTGTARDHLRALERKGQVELPGGGGHRQVRLKHHARHATQVPVIGRVVAGVPVLAEQDIEMRIAVPSEWLDRSPHFALRVAGDSMAGAGILQGDCVIVRHQATAHDGEIVVATIDGESTLKRLQRRGKRYALVAENPRYAPIEIGTEAATIHGVVVGLLRRVGVPESMRAPVRRGRKVGRRGT